MTDEKEKERAATIRSLRADVEVCFASLGSLALLIHYESHLAESYITMPKHVMEGPKLPNGPDRVKLGAETLAEVRSLLGKALEVLGDAANDGAGAGVFAEHVSTPVMLAMHARNEGKFTDELGQ
jgi:hypothetical protein